MLGEKIFELRRNRKISQEEFAQILNTSRQAISKWERNEAKPDIDKLILISKLFNVSIDYLLSYEISREKKGSFFGAPRYTRLWLVAFVRCALSAEDRFAKRF